MTAPTFTNDAIVFGILMFSLGFVFYTESKTDGFWYKFYKIVFNLPKKLLVFCFLKLFVI